MANPKFEIDLFDNRCTRSQVKIVDTKGMTVPFDVPACGRVLEVVNRDFLTMDSPYDVNVPQEMLEKFDDEWFYLVSTSGYVVMVVESMLELDNA